MTQDINAIVRGLTKAQATALCAIVDRGNNPYGWTATDIGASGAAMNALRAKGLLMSDYRTPAAYRFQGSAPAVRALLSQDTEAKG